jgi:hypothetical protein
MDERTVNLLMEELMDAGHSQGDIDQLKALVEQTRLTRGDAAAETLLKGASYKARDAVGGVDKTLRPTKVPKTSIVGDNMVTKNLKGFKEQLGGNMTGPSKVDHIKDGMKISNPTEVQGKVDKFRKARVGGLNRIANEASEEMSGKMGKVLGGAEKFMGKGTGKAAKTAGKMLGKVPGLGAIAGPALALLASGNPNDAMASFAGSDNIGEGSDETGDMDISRADLGDIERRAIEGRSDSDKNITDIMSEGKAFPTEFLDEEEEDTSKKRSFDVLG